MNCWLGIDAGTSGIKAVVIDESGRILGRGYEELDVLSPLPGYAEQNPADWWNACNKAVKRAVSADKIGKEIQGIGFSGQMQGTVFLDKDKEPIRNCLIWLDQRSGQQVDYIEARIAESGDEIVNITGNHCLNSFWAPKILWLKENEPENYEKIDKVVFTKDYLSYCMTGEIATEVSDASLTFLMDVPKRKWSDRMFGLTGIPKSMAPERLLESCDIVGGLLKSVADEWGMNPGIPVVAGGGDQTANGIGTGIIEDGIMGCSIGTSAVVFGCCKNPFIDRKKRAIFSMCHSVPNMWSYLGMALTAGASLKWVRDILFAHKKEECRRNGVDIYDYISAIASKAQPGCEGVVFLPWFNGDSTPNNDANARAGYFGMSLRSGMPELCRSVMEGVTYSLRETVEICRESGNEVTEVRASGGGAKSPLWRQIQADIYNANVISMNIDEGPAAGAAIMAGVGSGFFKDVKEGCQSILKIGEVTVPNPENVKIYNEYFQTYHRLYGDLKETFAQQAELVKRNMV